MEIIKNNDDEFEIIKTEIMDSNNLKNKYRQLHNERKNVVQKLADIDQMMQNIAEKFPDEDLAPVLSSRALKDHGKL